MSQAQQSFAFFTLTGDFEPAQITSHLGVEPSASWTKAGKWSLESRLGLDHSLTAHMLDVLKQLEPCAKKIDALRAQFDCWMQAIVHLYSESSSVRISEDVIARCALLNLSVDVDYVYFVSAVPENS